MKNIFSLGMSLTSLILLLTSCAPSLKTESLPPMPSTKITLDEAVSIASAYVPPDALSRAEITAATYPLYAKKPRSWVIIFNNVFVTSEQLVKFGWKANTNTDFNPPDDSYARIIIHVDTSTGDIIRKSATNGLYLGGPPGSETPPNHAPIIWIVVGVIDGLGIFALIWLWRRERRYKNLEEQTKLLQK